MKISRAENFFKRCCFCLLILGLCVLFSKPALAESEAAYNYNEQGMSFMRGKKYQKAINAFKTAHNYLPYNQNISKNLAIAYNNYGFSLMMKGELPRAIEQFENALYFNPDDPFTLYNLGQAYYKSQNLPKAKEFLEKTNKLKPDLKGAKALLDKVNREVNVERSFDKLNTMHFIVAFSKDLPVENLSYIRTYLEEAYGRIGMFLDYYPKDKTVAVLYSDSNYRNLLNNRPHWTMAIFDGKVRIPVNKFKCTSRDVIKIIYHEYAHSIVRHITGGNCPLWLNEGIASKAEDFAEPKDKKIIKDYIERFGITPVWSIPGNFSKLKDMNIATLMYIESYLLVDFVLKKGGRSVLMDILTSLGRQENITAVLEREFKEPLREFETKWENYLQSTYNIDAIRYR